MLIDTNGLQKDEQVYLEMQQQFEEKGYRLFKMRKFEEYALYLDNKNFLGSESVLTFNDPSGKLMALKPDVTLSIVKNARTVENDEKVYYRESVYRFDKNSREFKEINQLGLECVGKVDIDRTIEICLLAEKCLSVIDKDFVFALSSMAFVRGLIESLGLKSESSKNKIVDCLKMKNAHDLRAIAIADGANEERVSAAEAVAKCPCEFAPALEVAKKVCVNDDMKNAVKELESIYDAVKNTPTANNMRLDFSILNNIDYYNGVIFQGFVAKMPKALLSGGRYDLLLEKFGKNEQAMGFAVSLGELAAYYPRRTEI